MAFVPLPSGQSFLVGLVKCSPLMQELHDEVMTNSKTLCAWPPAVYGVLA